MLKNLFDEQQSYLNFFFNHVDIKQAESVLDCFIGCEGVIFFVGVGKSGIVAQKIATTMTSVGTKALTISAMDAMHGDIGIVTEKDIVVLISKSGETDELLNLVPYLRNKGAHLIAIVSRENSRLEKACSQHILLPLKKELCPFDLAPTTSAAIQMVFGDILAVAMMHSKEFTLYDYARNHPAGRIGRRITMRVRDLMLTDESLPICSPDDKLVDMLVELSDKKCGCLLIVKEGVLLGIFTDGDLRRALQYSGGDVLQKKMCELHASSPRTANPDMLVVDAIQIMEEDQKHPIMILPVLKNGMLVGLIKMHDIIQSGL